MSGKGPASSSQFSGKITQKLIEQAEDLFGPTLSDEQIQPVLDEMLEQVDELADQERHQVEELARLMARSHAEGEDPAYAPLSLPGKFELVPSSDRMFLALSVRPPVGAGEPVSVNDVLGHLKERGIKQGVDVSAIRRAVSQVQQQMEEVEDVLVVRGKPARPGTDAVIDRFGRRTAEGDLEKLSASMLEGQSIWMCREGDVVMRYHPPIPGQPGHDALGQTIQPPEPASSEPAAGRFVRVEGGQYTAEVNGVVVFEDEHVEVRKALMIQQDLTSQSDPIDFDGEVHVRAAVRSGAQIRATGNIMVDGPVEAAEIESTGADVLLKSGVAGKSAAVVRAARDVQARFAEAASLFAGRNISLQVGALHARLIAHEQILVNQGKGHLAGGVVMAGQQISVKQLGARGGVRTDVTVGLDAQVLKALAQIDQLVARATQRRDSALELAEQIRRAVGDPEKLAAKELAVYTKLKQLELVSDVQIRRLHERRRNMLAESARDGGGRIDVLGSIMSNVHVTIGSGDLSLNEGRLGPCHLVFEQATERVVVRPGL